MANTRGRSPREDDQANLDAAIAAEAAEATEEAERRTPEPENADESRAVDDAPPAWAADAQVAEVMSSKDMRRAQVIENLRRNTGHLASLEQRADGGAVVVVGPAGAWLESTLRAEMTTDGNTAAHAVEDILNRVMNAQTAEELFAEDTTVDAKDLLGVKLQVWGFKVNESEFQQGMPGYMLINAIRLDTKEDLLVTCGAYKVQGQMLRAKTLGLLPQNLHFTSAQTKAGNTTYQLVLDKD